MATRNPAMSEELEQLLKNLKLRRMLEIYEEQLRAAEKQDVTYSEFLTRLLRAQWHHRQESALEYRIRRANLDRKSTRLNSSHLGISYAVFCLKKKKTSTVVSISPGAIGEFGSNHHLRHSIVFANVP